MRFLYEILLIVYFLYFYCKIGCDIFLKVEVRKEILVIFLVVVFVVEKKEMFLEREELEKER